MNLKNFAKRFILIFVALTFLAFGSCSVYAEGGKVEYMDMVSANYKYGDMLLNSVDPALGMETGTDGNLLKKEKLTADEQSVYDDIKKDVDELVKSADSDNSVLSIDVKKTKAIYNWIIKNIAYDENSLNPTTFYDFDKGVGGAILSLNPERKPQDALNTYKNKTAVCAGRAFLFELMMRMANLPCVCAANDIHAFNAAWLDRGDGKPCWMLIDPTLVESSWPLEDNVAMFAQGESVKKPQYESKVCNFFFTSLFNGSRFVHNVCPPMTELSKDVGSGQKISMCDKIVIDDPKITDGALIYCHGGFTRSEAVYDKKSSSSQKFALPKDLMCLSKKWKLLGDFKQIQDLNLFVEKEIRLDIGGTSFSETVEKDGVLFEIYGGGFEAQKDSEGKTIYQNGKPIYQKSVLQIKPKDGVSVAEVSIPQELKIFLGDIGKIQVESDSIKTVKYSLLQQCDSLKEGIELPGSVKFEKIVKPSENV